MSFAWRSRRLWSLVIADFFLLILAYYGAFWLRFVQEIPPHEMEVFERTVLPVVLFKLGLIVFFRCYQALGRYFSLVDFVNLTKAVVAGTGTVIIVILMANRFEGYARSVYILDGILSLFFLGGVRLAIRCVPIRFSLLKWRKRSGQDAAKRRRVLVAGAGDAGEDILREVQKNGALSIHVVGLVDDDRGKWGCSLHGRPVLGAIDDLPDIAECHQVDEVIIAMPSASGQAIRRVVNFCEAAGVPFKTLPGVGELLDGRVTVNRARDVDYRDLLRREPVPLEDEKIRAYICDRRILITGAGGSIGSELCRQIGRYKPAELILCDKTENNLYHIEIELRQTFPELNIRSVLGNVTNLKHTYHLFCAFKPQVVFHAAAYKHVPMVELNPWEAIFNNIIGTRNVLQCSHLLKAETFVMVSTDKAVRPTNVMGATKRIAEMLTGAYNHFCPATRFVTVRFGNVVGSEGSVLPMFKKQIAKGGPVLVTHPDITRYFMTIPEASQLILQAGCMGEGGEIFILDMGIPIRIVDMARDLIRLSGLRPDEDIAIEFIGLRPGEKLYEELITQGEGIVKTHHDKILVLQGVGQSLETLNESIKRLVGAADAFDAEGIREQLKEIVPEYHFPVKANDRFEVGMESLDKEQLSLRKRAVYNTVQE
ncbi:MAG: polysaccharide biosynthesis protein [Deltaproteobacteria bacterium]|nr:polysaccharide biosynthesis protein [Deltaproteobacteria bacterium]